MQFDLTKLPNKPLSLCEMVTFLAWGVAMTGDELREFGHPAEMARKSEWDAQLEECRKQALTDLELSADEEERRKQALAELDLSGLIIGIDETWPPACQGLHQRWHRAQQHLHGEKAKLAQAAEDWRQAALYGQINVSGRLFGSEPVDPPVDIPDMRFEHYRPDWESDVIEPDWKASGPNRPKRRRENPSYYDVRCSRESFVEWRLDKASDQTSADASFQIADQPTRITPARVAVEEGNGRPFQKKMTPGRLPLEREWQLIKPIALAIYKEDGPYSRDVGFTQTRHAKKTLDQFRKELEQHRKVWPDLKCPSEPWVKKRLRQCNAELDKIHL